jgi:hypothetical protein
MSVFDTGNIGYLATLIRVLFVLAMVGFMVIAGALAQHGASRPGRPGRSNARFGPAVAEPRHRYFESNDSDASVPDSHRRAA